MDNGFDKLALISQTKIEHIGNENIDSFFNDNTKNDIQKIFMLKFQTYPNEILFTEGIIGRKLRDLIIDNYSQEIKDCFYKSDERMLGFWEYYFYLNEDTMIYHNYHDTTIYYRNTPFEKINKLVTEISLCQRKKIAWKPEISMICKSNGGLTTKNLHISRPKLSIKDNYNDDFEDIHNIILKRLRKKNDKGLVLLHGKPGTGKTSYLRYLITLTKKDVIFLPPNLAESITQPGLIELLMDNHNSIFVIEDAENILIDRNQTGSSAVSALLNLTDGLLSDSLGIQIVCSFNTDISRLDSALLRKGRLIAKYEFNELATHKAQALSDKLGFNTVISKPTTLTDIYNQSEKQFTKLTTTRKSVGFNVAI